MSTESSDRTAGVFCIKIDFTPVEGERLDIACILFEGPQEVSGDALSESISWSVRAMIKEYAAGLSKLGIKHSLGTVASLLLFAFGIILVNPRADLRLSSRVSGELAETFCDDSSSSLVGSSDQDVFSVAAFDPTRIAQINRGELEYFHAAQPSNLSEEGQS